MNRLIVFGCSLSAAGHLTSWSDEVSARLKLTLLNFAIPASSNPLQVKRFQEYVVNNSITNDDLIIWQITGVERGYKRVSNRWPWLGSINHNSESFNGSINYFDNKPRIDQLCHHTESVNSHVDEEEVLQELVFHLKVAKQFTKKLLVIIGWDTAIPDNYINLFKEFLNSNNISYVDKSILSHTIENNLSLLPDGSHPGEEAYISFANNCIIPKLKELGIA